MRRRRRRLIRWMTVLCIAGTATAFASGYASGGTVADGAIAAGLIAVAMVGAAAYSIRRYG